MSISGLFNKTCSWKRKSFTQVDEFGEPIYTETIVDSDVGCAFQEITKDLIENIPVEGNRRVFDLFLETGKDILPEDVLVIDGSDNYIVTDIDDAAGRGHHLEVMVEQNKEV